MTFKKYIIIIVTTFLFSNSLFAETITKQLTTLNNLYKEGAITEEEFSKAKKILLESDTKGKTKIEDEKKVDEKKKKKIKKVKNYNEDLSKTFISLDELDQIGKYKKIEIVPEGMFKIKMSEEGRSKKAMEEMANTFIKKKRFNGEISRKYNEGYGLLRNFLYANT